MPENLSIKLLHRTFTYNPQTGSLNWRERDRNLSGVEAGGTSSPDGYRRIRIGGTIYLAHRIIIAMETGKWPTDQVDHINGDRGDNRIENLRAVSRAENLLNKAQYRTNKSGVSGVHWHKQHRKWAASIQHGNKRRMLGVFSSFEDACAAREAAQADLGFHPNHGRIAQ